MFLTLTIIFLNLCYLQKNNDSIILGLMTKKYRPQKFGEVCGQKPIVQTLVNALRMGRVANAYLFAGSRGTGKTTLARILAKALNCENPDDSFEPCGTCSSCREITSGSSLDVIEIDGASNRGIDDIRGLNDTVSYATKGKCKVYIIDEVHMLTKEAFNALLKTLEEPPSNVRFFFATTEPHKVLPTIISRCQRFDLARISTRDIVEKLTRIAGEQEIEVTPDALELIARLAEGGLRDAESLLDQMICFATSPITVETVQETLGLTPKDDFIALDRAAHAHDLPFAFSLADKIFSSGRDLAHFLQELAEHYRALLHDALTNKETTYTKEQLFYILDYLMPWLEKLSKSPFKQFHLEVILLHIIRSTKRIPIDALVHKLEELKKMPGAEPKPAPVQETSEPSSPQQPPPVAKEIPTTPSDEPPAPQMPASNDAATENLLRFASVELNGSVQK